MARILPAGRCRSRQDARGSGVLSADRATPKADPLLAILLGAGGGELVAAAGTGGDPYAAGQVQGGRLGTSAPARAPTRRQVDGRVKGGRRPVRRTAERPNGGALGSALGQTRGLVVAGG